MKKLSIIIPVYYNHTSLPLLFKELLDLENRLIEKDVSLELIFVDDGSGDESFSVLLAFRAQRSATRIIKHSRNFGAIRAVRTGLHYVSGDCLTVLSADLQDPPQLIDQMVEHWLDGARYVTCVRTERDDPLGSRIFSFLFYKLVRFLAVKDFPDGGFDLVLMDKVILPYLLQSGKNMNFALYVHALGFTPVVIYYKRQKREHGKSRWTFAKKFNYFVDSLIGFSIISIRLISGIGVSLAILSFIYGLVVAISTIINGAVLPGFAALATLISFLSGLMLVMMGIMGEYMWRIFDQINGSPEAVVETAMLE
jgi:polyisoprenyl-phosphate glycosyltransferase